MILEQANHRANQTIEESKARAREEGQRLVKMAEDDIEQQMIAARASLVGELSDLTLASTKKVLGAAIDDETNQKLVDQLVREV